MTEPTVPHKFEISVEVPGTPEQVWDAIATAKGISSWMLRTELDPQVGGDVTFHMGPDSASHGKVTTYDAPTRLVYEEDVATLLGKEQGEISPLATEFVVEAKSGGTCVVRVVSSAFGHGADWEREFFEEMGTGWTPAFSVLRLYLERFAGQASTQLEAGTTAARPVDEVWGQVRAGLGIEAVGQTVDLRGTKAVVEDLHPTAAVLAAEDGLWVVNAFGPEPGSAMVQLQAHFFGADAPARVDAEQPGWQAWLTEVAG